MRKKDITKILILYSVSVVGLTTNVFAGVGDLFPDNIPRTDVLGLMSIIINGLLAISGTIAVWFIIVGGFQYVTSSGNPESVEKAKTTILYAIIGLVTVIISWAVIGFVITQMTG